MRMEYKVLTGRQEKLRRLMSLRFASFFDDMQLTGMQALALEFIISRSEYGDVFPKDVEAFLFIRGSSAVSLINNLERDGYLRRATADFDGRYKRLLPTEKALAIKDEISNRINRYNESLFVGISDDDLEVFRSVVEKMIKNAE